MKKFKCSIYRGGTSKAACFYEKDMPARVKWGEFLADVMGTATKQIDGIGGAASVTSKVAIVDIKNNELTYTFAQVNIDKEMVDFNSNCGNISSCVGAFAYDLGLIDLNDSKMYEKIIIKDECDLENKIICVRILNTNTNKYLKARFKLSDDLKGFEPAGDTKIAGVPNTASEIKLGFINPEGSMNKGLLPTNSAKQVVNTSFGNIEISIVDAGAALVFMRAKDLLSGNMYDEISQNELDKIEEVRSIASELIGLAKKEEATAKNPSVPKACLVDFVQDYTSTSGAKISKNDINVCVRMMSMQRPHPSIAVTGTVCISMAAKTQGTLINEHLSSFSNELVIAHPSGTITGFIDNDSVSVIRTARCLMQGYVFTRKDY
ncbi:MULTISPECIES: PrpF domain-containing protein [unclassified Campylobacter]|uniref:PrpF domain-containing protein n=1 Tax=unclassified Campylobacter TaxID=2593542 RepID=UPI001DBE69B7|nr:3-methylitaconate isomerase [Campylobacter sp. RM9331]MBZ8005918.1 3-methylitaconate isomerase [Campylobacter sp. RM9332]